MSITWDIESRRTGKPLRTNEVDTSPRRIATDAAFSTNFNDVLESSEAEIPEDSEDAEDGIAASQALSEPGVRKTLDEMKRELGL